MSASTEVIIFRSPVDGLRVLATELADEGVEGWGEEKTKTGYAHHPEQHRRAERLAHLCARAGRDRERGNAEDEREGGHQDRAKPCAGGVHSGVCGGDALFLFLARELDNQDGVLGSEADENNEADLRQDVDGHAAGE